MVFIKQTNRPSHGPISAKQVSLIKTHIYGLTFTNEGFLISGGSGEFVFSISAQSDNFEILALCSAKEKVQNGLETN